MRCSARLGGCCWKPIRRDLIDEGVCYLSVCYLCESVESDVTDVVVAIEQEAAKDVHCQHPQRTVRLRTRATVIRVRVFGVQGSGFRLWFRVWGLPCVPSRERGRVRSVRI